MFRTLPLALLLTACASGDDNFRFGEGTRWDATTPPEFEHHFDDTPRTAGQSFSVDAIVYSGNDIDEVTLHYQRETDGSEWRSTPMLLEPAAEEPQSGATAVMLDAFGDVPASFVSSAGVRYYMHAVDEYGNESCSPNACAQGPWHVPVAPPRN